MRQTRQSWVEITQFLQNQGLKVSRTTVIKFFKRSSQMTLPLGFNDNNLNEAPQTQNSARSSPSDQTLHHQAIVLTPDNQVQKEPWFNYNPDHRIQYTPKN
jgi:hypothetical protein